MNRTRLLVASSLLCLLTPACDFGRAEAERAHLEAQLREREAMGAFLQQQLLELQATQVAMAKAEVMALHAASDHFAKNNGGEYPDELAVLAQADVNGATYLGRPAVPLDPWGNAYAYEPPGGGRDLPIVTCLGEDGATGGVGLAADITRLDAVEASK